MRKSHTAEADVLRQVEQDLQLLRSRQQAADEEEAERLFAEDVRTEADLLGSLLDHYKSRLFKVSDRKVGNLFTTLGWLSKRENRHVGYAYRRILDIYTDLQNIIQSVINHDRKDEGEVTLRRFDYPEPEIEGELGRIEDRSLAFAQAAHTLSVIGLENAETELQIAGLHEIANRCEKLAREIGMHAISEGKLSQLQLSKLLGVAQLTVGRWVKAAQEQKQQDQ